MIHFVKYVFKALNINFHLQNFEIFTLRINKIKMLKFMSGLWVQMPNDVWFKLMRKFFDKILNL